MMFARLLCASVIQRGSSRAHEYESSNYYPSSRQTHNSGISEIVRVYFLGIIVLRQFADCDFHHRSCRKLRRADQKQTMAEAVRSNSDCCKGYPRYLQHVRRWILSFFVLFILLNETQQNHDWFGFNVWIFLCYRIRTLAILGCFWVFGQIFIL